MVTDVYSRILDEDRRYNAAKMDQEFYSSLDVDNEAKAKEAENNAVLLELLKNMSDDDKEKLIKKLNKTSRPDAFVSKISNLVSKVVSKTPKCQNF